MQRTFLATTFLLFSLVGISETRVYFEEKFLDDSWQKKWIYSEYPGKSYGKFVRSAGRFYQDVEFNKGLQTTGDARHYVISRKFPPFTNEGRHLVVQLSVRYDMEFVNCSGGYIKLLDCSFDPKQLSHNTPYELMFGPDICGANTKHVQAIFGKQGRNIDRHHPLTCKTDVLTHFYTLIVFTNNSYEILIDGKAEEQGSLEDAWQFLPDKLIKDVNAKQPEDWDSRRFIEDPSVARPKDWNKPEFIADPESVRPPDWDDAFDGEWMPAMIKNPDYKEWEQPKVQNENYSGEWAPPSIPNPEYFPDENLYRFDEICAVAIEVWQLHGGTIIDNILLTDNVTYAEEQRAFLEDLQRVEDQLHTNYVEAVRKENAEEFDEDEEDEETHVHQSPHNTDENDLDITGIAPKVYGKESMPLY